MNDERREIAKAVMAGFAHDLDPTDGATIGIGEEVAVVAVRWAEALLAALAAPSASPFAAPQEEPPY